MAFTLWMLVIGLLLVTMAMSSSVLRRLPLSTSMLYLAAGVAIGPVGVGLLRIDPLEHASLIERAAEIAVLISLFASGMKVRLEPRDPRWWLTFRLAFGSMAVTVALVTAAAVTGLGLPLGAAILLGAVLAPTDPVLASDVQMQEPGDRDRVRFALTSEAGLNDGTAFPFVMLGLGLLGLHELGDHGVRWLLVDALWAVTGGLAIGAALGTLVGRLILFLRVRHREAEGLDEFLTLGLIALAYGAALLAHAYGFLAVFAAGYALQHVAMRAAPPSATSDDTIASGADADEAASPATHPAKAPEHLTREVLSFNEQLERIGEVAVVLGTGALLSLVQPGTDLFWFVPLLLLVIRPVSVAIGLAGTRVPLTGRQRALIGWFGIRGIGSVYYLFYAVNHGLERELALELIAITLAVVAVSVVVHGISVTPLMNRYARTREARAARA